MKLLFLIPFCRENFNIFLIILSLESQWQISFDYRQLKSTSGNILRVGDEENDAILRVRLESGRLLFSSNVENNGNLTSREEQNENNFYEPIRLEGEYSIVSPVWTCPPTPIFRIALKIISQLRYLGYFCHISDTDFFQIKSFSASLCRKYLRLL